jgi:hypothetical protein
MRPVEFFLSHQHDDRTRLVELEAAMRRRGLASWRDRKSLQVGDETDEMVATAIARETSGFVLFGSDRIAASDYVWLKEWPRAHARHEAERSSGLRAPYRVIPVFVDGVGGDLLQEAALSRGQPSLLTFNGEFLQSDNSSSHDSLARRLVSAALVDRAVMTESPLRLHLSTFRVANDLAADILVDWRMEVEGGDPDWAALIRAGDDLAAELAALSRPLEIDAQARLTAAFVLGHAFPLASRVDITAVHRDGQRWRLQVRPNGSAIAVETELRAEGDPAIAVVEVSLARSVAAAAGEATTRRQLNPGRVLRLEMPPSVSEVDAEVAGASAAAFGQGLRALRDGGVREAHVFLAAPAALAVLLGAAIDAGPAMTLYASRDGRSQKEVRLTA